MPGLRQSSATPCRTVDIWRLEIARHPNAGHRFEAALDAPERIRLDTMRNVNARLQYAAGRWLLRRILARRLGRSETQVELTIGPHGRPSLVTGEVDFNLSHAGSFVVLALSSARVGIDVEATGRAMNWRAVARRFFSAVETAAIEACAEEERRVAFFRTWVRKEAFVKALGTGVATGLDRFDVSTGTEAALLAARIEGVDAPDWSIRDFEPGAGYLGAVAVHAADPRIRIHDVEP